jgi:flavodoxin
MAGCSRAFFSGPLKGERMKALVTYYSQTGNTGKLAHAIFDGIAFVEKEISTVQDAKHLENNDLFFVGFPVHSHSIPGPAEKFLKKIPDGKMIAFFATHGSLRGGELAITAFFNALSLARGKRVLGTFGCRGKVKPSLTEKLMKNPEDRQWALEAQSAIHHPDEHDMEDAARWARWMVMKATST